ncbi:MAG: cell division protein FtsA [Candidatus Paceibacterota bacterium]|jgi:cell division protein FtsA
MSKTQITTGIDIGTDTIKILAVKKDFETGKILDVVFLDKIKSFGIQKGRIKNVAEVSKKIQELIDKSDQMQGKRSRDTEVFVNINGNKLQLISSRGLILVGRADQKVSQEDKDRIFQNTKAVNLQATNKDILDIFPKEWILDGEKEIKDPLGLHGTRLELEAFLLSAFSSDLDNIIEAGIGAGMDLDVENIVPSPIADARSVLTPEQRELGVAMVNIGASTTSVIIFEEGKLLDLAVFPIGSANITNDIAIGFKTEIEIAEKIKKEFGACSLSGNQSNKKIEMDISLFDNEKEEDISENKTIELIDDNLKKSKSNKVKIKKDKKNTLIFNEKDLRKIIDARVGEIYELVAAEIKKVSRHGMLPGGVVLTGGGSKMPGMIDLAKKEFNLPCRVGYPKGFNDQIKDPCFATVCGLVIDDFDEDSLENGKGGEDGLSGKLFGRIGNFIKNLMP